MIILAIWPLATGLFCLWTAFRRHSFIKMIIQYPKMDLGSIKEGPVNIFGKITAHENELLRYGTEALESIAGVQIVGTAAHKAGILSFVMDAAHPHDIGTILDEQGIAIRTGHHCAQPVMQRFQIPATARASLAFYNTKEDIDALVKGIDRVIEVFS